METTIELIADRVLIEQEGKKEEKVGSIIVPNISKEKKPRGIVIAVGPGTDTVKMAVKEGDLVYFGMHAGTEINIEDKDYLMMRQSDILAIIRKK